MEIPRTCYYCRFQGLKSISLGDNRIVYFHSCSLLCKNVDDYENNRREDCPLKEVPEFFSDLIERDAVLNVCEFIGERNDMEYLGNDNYAARYEEIEKIPAIIRKEE